MRNKNTRKGFTTVELVIVIAVIAILATVLIPTFSNLINQANLSTDKQNVRNMNMVLLTHMFDDAEHFGVIREQLKEGGYKTGEEFEPKTDGYKYYWYVDEVVENGVKKNISVILLVDENGAKPEVVYPEEYIDANLNINALKEDRKCFDFNWPAAVIETEKSPVPIDIDAKLDDGTYVTVEDVKLALQYTFIAEEKESVKYADWKATFYVSADLPDGVDKVDLLFAGYYESYGKWEFCALDNVTENAEPFDLLYGTGLIGPDGLSYATDIQGSIKRFECGVIDRECLVDSEDMGLTGVNPYETIFDGDCQKPPAGTKITVELRLTNDSTNEEAVIGVFNYTFQ